MEILRIDNNKFIKLADSNLQTFAEQVIVKVKGNETYKDVLSFFTAMETQAGIYAAALALAKNGSVAQGKVKNKEKELLKEKLVFFGYALLAYSGGDSTYIEGAGMPLIAKRVKPVQNTTPLATPIVIITATGQRGTVRFNITLLDASKVKIMKLRYSVDQGETWIDGKDFTATKFTLTDLPSGMLTFQVQSVGAGGKKSVWSDSITLSVP